MRKDALAFWANVSGLSEMSKPSRALMVDCPNCGAKTGEKCIGETYCPERWEKGEKLGRIKEKLPDLRKPMDPEVRRIMKRIRE